MFLQHHRPRLRHLRLRIEQPEQRGVVDGVAPVGTVEGDLPHPRGDVGTLGDPYHARHTMATHPNEDRSADPVRARRRQVAICKASAASSARM